MMIGGHGAPCLVHACTIVNKSNDHVYVRVLYEPIQTHGDDQHERRVEFQLPRSSQTFIEEAEFDMGSYRRRQTIRTIEITRSNGQIQEINAPFENGQWC